MDGRHFLILEPATARIFKDGFGVSPDDVILEFVLRIGRTVRNADQHAWFTCRRNCVKVPCLSIET